MTPSATMAGDPNHAVLRVHFVGDVVEPVDAFAEALGDAVDEGACNVVGSCRFLKGKLAFWERRAYEEVGLAGEMRQFAIHVDEDLAADVAPAPA